MVQTMYVDKTLSGIKGVQTLSRLNRALRSKKHDVFVLDFLNDGDTIRDAFADFYRATILADESDPNKLRDLQAELDRAQMYSEEQVAELVRRYLGGEDRDTGSIRSWTPAWRSIGATWTRTGRWRSRAAPRRSCAPRLSCRRCCGTPTPSGRSARSS